MLTYYGIAKRCYANSAAMLLSSIGEEVAPPRIEALTGMGLGRCTYQMATVLRPIRAGSRSQAPRSRCSLRLHRAIVVRRMRRPHSRP